MLDLFNSIDASKLALYREEVNYKINTNSCIYKPKMYRLTRTKTRAIKAYINNILSYSFIYSSMLLYALPVLVVKKPSSSLRIYVDYC